MYYYEPTKDSPYIIPEGKGICFSYHVSQLILDNIFYYQDGDSEGWDPLGAWILAIQLFIQFMLHKNRTAGSYV